MVTASRTDAVVQRLQALIDEGTAIPQGSESYHIASAPMAAWRTRTVSFLLRTFGSSDTYTVAFMKETDTSYVSGRDDGVAVLRNLLGDVQGGYLDNLFLGIAGDILADLLDLAAWSLGEGSREAGAILAGSALELGLKRIASSASIEMEKVKGIDALNQALAKAGVYGATRRVQIDAWRVLRNHAIHGEHEAYSNEEVRLMLEGVRALLADQLQ